MQTLLLSTEYTIIYGENSFGHFGSTSNYMKTLKFYTLSWYNIILFLLSKQYSNFSFLCVNNKIPMNYRTGLGNIPSLLYYYSFCVLQKYKNIIHVPITFYGIYFVDV